MKKRLLLFQAFVIFCWLVQPVSAQENFYLKYGDRLVFYGDSITEQRLYTNFIESYVVTRFPKLKVKFINKGWSGDKISGGGGGTLQARLTRDVLPYHPDVMVVLLGMNDANFRSFDQENLERFIGGYDNLIGTVKKIFPVTRMTLAHPTAYDDFTTNASNDVGYNDVLLRFGQSVKSLAESKQLDYVDFNAPMAKVLMSAARVDPALARGIIPDRIHPSAAGHWVMAAELLKNWNAPALVSAVEINAEAQAVSLTKNTEVTELERKGNQISWNQLDQALPAPIALDDKILALALKVSDMTESLNKQTLRVINLTEPNYTLKIDGEIVGRFSNESFSNGINLATILTPMMRQAYLVHELTNKHIDLQFTRWRQIQMPFEKSLTLRALKVLTKLDKLEGDVVRQQWEMAQPKLRRYELIP
jgi:lysophospholipase L1-like esterase